MTRENWWTSLPRARQLATVVRKATTMDAVYAVCDTVRKEGLVADWVVDLAAQRQAELIQAASAAGGR